MHLLDLIFNFNLQADRVEHYLVVFNLYKLLLSLKELLPPSCDLRPEHIWDERPDNETEIMYIPSTRIHNARSVYLIEQFKQWCNAKGRIRCMSRLRFASKRAYHGTMLRAAQSSLSVALVNSLICAEHLHANSFLHFQL